MFKKLLLGLFTILLIIGGSNMANAKTWDKTFQKSDNDKSGKLPLKYYLVTLKY